MPRPSELAADARALYGPLDLRPAAGAVGDGALWVDPGSDGALYQVQSGNWVRIAGTGATGALGAAPPGTPTLRGPYSVDYTDIPHDGDTMTLWTPAVGDVLLRLFPDWQTVVPWDAGQLFVGQHVDGVTAGGRNIILQAPGSLIGRNGPGSGGGDLDNILDATQGIPVDGAGAQWYGTAYVFGASDPVQIQLAQTGGPDPGAGHVDLYALIARAVSP